MHKKLIWFLLIFLLNVSSDASAAGKPGEKLKGSIVFDKRLELAISLIDQKAKPDERVFAAKFTNRTADTIRFYFEDCCICFWSISVNRGEFLPMDCAKHVVRCPYRDLVELEPGQSAIKTLVWQAYPQCNTKKAYNDPLHSVRIRYLLKREAVTEPVVYLESNELRFD
jgi:hypothetical protein